MCTKPWGKQDLVQGGKSQVSPLPSHPEKFPASDIKGEIKLGSLLHQNKLVAFHDKINLSFFQSSNKPTMGSNNKKSPWEYPDGLFWSYYNFGIISHSFFGYIIRIRVQNDDFCTLIFWIKGMLLTVSSCARETFGIHCCISTTSTCGIYHVLWNNNVLKGVAIWAHGPESGCDTGDVCYTREAHGLREKYSRET